MFSCHTSYSIIGVILSTAFCHLLQDAFESLTKPDVQKRYNNVGRWTGLIMCVHCISHADRSLTLWAIVLARSFSYSSLNVRAVPSTVACADSALQTYRRHTSTTCRTLRPPQLHQKSRRHHTHLAPSSSPHCLTGMAENLHQSQLLCIQMNTLPYYRTRIRTRITPQRLCARASSARR